MVDLLNSIISFPHAVVDSIPSRLGRFVGTLVGVPLTGALFFLLFIPMILAIAWESTE